MYFLLGLRDKYGTGLIQEVFYKIGGLTKEVFYKIGGLLQEVFCSGKHFYVLCEYDQMRQLASHLGGPMMQGALYCMCFERSFACFVF